MAIKMNKKQKEQIAVLAKRFEVSAEDVTAKFEKLMSSPKLEKLDAKARSGMVVRKLHAIYANAKNKAEFGAKPEPVIFRVEAKEEPTSFKRAGGEMGYRSSVYVVAQTTGDPYFTVLTLWGDANEINPELVNGKTYKTQCVVGAAGLSMNDAETLESVDDELPPMADVVTKAYPVVEMDNVELNVSEDYNDLKLLKGIIAGGWTKETKAGNQMGFLKIISEDGDEMILAKFSRIYDQVNLYDDGSLVYVLSQITAAVYDEETGEVKYDVSAWGNLIIPIEAILKEIDAPEDDEDFTDEDFESTDDTESDEDDENWDVEDDEDENWD